jgi:hypothetical protein
MSMRTRWKRAASAALFLFALPAAAANPAARFETLSDVDCPGPGQIIAETAPAPVALTHLRVQYMGDPGSDQLAREIASTITWDVGNYTGLHVPASAQRGYEDGPPRHGNAFQLDCNGAGFFIDTSSFPHSVPIFGAGPSVGIARLFEPAIRAFGDTSSTLIFEARIAVPWVSTPTAPVEGAAQVSLLYYARDLTGSAVFAHVIGLFDNRAPELAASVETVQWDGEVFFVGSLLRDEASGFPAPRYVRVPPFSQQMRFHAPFTQPLLFRAELPYAVFRDLLVRFKADAGIAMSTDPRDYGITVVGVLGEVFPGTGTAHEVSIGASVTELRLLRSTPRPRVSPTILR